MEKEVHVDTYVDVEIELSTSEISEAIEEDETRFEDIQGYEAWPFHEVWDWVTEQSEYKEIECEVDKVKELEALVEKQNLKLELLDRIFKSVQALSEQMSHTTNVLETEINAVEETGLHDIYTALPVTVDRQTCINSVEEAGPPDTFTACSDNGVDHA